MSTGTASTGRMDVDTDEIAAALAGDTAARWRALEACREYLQLVARRGHWSSQPGRTATSDLVQETILGAWGNFSQFQGRTPSQLRGWLRAILWHSSMKARRRIREVRIEGGGILFDPTTSPSQAADKNASQAAVETALAGLTDRSRMAVRLRLWDQRSFAEIGAELGVSEDAARMLYGRALVKLRELMRPGHDPG